MLTLPIKSGITAGKRMFGISSVFFLSRPTQWNILMAVHLKATTDRTCNSNRIKCNNKRRKQSGKQSKDLKMFEFLDPSSRWWEAIKYVGGRQQWVIAQWCEFMKKTLCAEYYMITPVFKWFRWQYVVCLLKNIGTVLYFQYRALNADFLWLHTWCR